MMRRTVVSLLCVLVVATAMAQSQGPEKEKTTVRHEVGITPETTQAITLALSKFGNTTYELAKQAMESLTKNGGAFLAFYYKATVEYIMIQGACYSLFGLCLVVGGLKLWRSTFAKAREETENNPDYEQFPAWHILCGIEVVLAFVGLIMFCHGLFDVGTAKYQAIQLIARQVVSLIPGHGPM